MVWRAWGETGPDTPTVVLLHGGSGSWMHWVRTIPALEDDYRLLVADLPGCGSSASPPEPYDAAVLADIVSEGLSRLVPEPVI
ncbi:MAG: alpha/beta fold hydrolase, partial [Alphaproteobacteria bacterium]|nr:alpha/beta fold hydrolase [Alphaproteobacteria bacterium]